MLKEHPPAKTTNYTVLHREKKHFAFGEQTEKWKYYK